MKTKNVLVLALLSSLTLFTSCEKDEEATTKNITLNISGLDDLGNDYVYEGWLIVDGSPVTTGTFMVDQNGNLSKTSYSVNISDADNATKFVLSIEPKNDTDPGPSKTKILVGDFSNDQASLSTGIVGDFSTVSGKYILATPTDGMNNNENSGIWWLDPTSGTPVAGLSLPTLDDGWIYEGWVVINGTPVSTGTFSKVAATDNADPYSGNMGLPSPNGADGFFPGEDFLNNAPSGLSFPVDISGGKAVISIEPVPDNSSNPFTLKPLVGDIPTNALDHHLYDMGANPNALSGTVTR